MSPATLVRTARSRGINLLALTDHNTAAHLQVFFELCNEAGITPVAGMEVTTAEDVHVLALFESPEPALDLENDLYLGVESVCHDPVYFGDQPVVDRDKNILRTIDHFLGTPTRFSFHEIGAAIHARGGLFIPAHIDRTFGSVITQLGFLPEDNYDAVEVTRDLVAGYPCTCSSDAHSPDAIGRRTMEYDAEMKGFSGLREALVNDAVTCRLGAQ